MTLTVPETEEPVIGSVRICEPLDGATVSEARGLRPPRLVTKMVLRAFETTTANGAMPTSTLRRT